MILGEVRVGSACGSQLRSNSMDGLPARALVNPGARRVEWDMTREIEKPSAFKPLVSGVGESSSSFVTVVGTRFFHACSHERAPCLTH